ncbi:amino acid ABC transporter permease [Kluyvera ascorbata]|jgi:amine acid ABC transporter, permease protein, 3-TM region, His/Glu/Gln/Arg/opine family|uniref:Amino acid ABC transporter permease n=1 Tax=Kluyvera ascorbata TaxID=51288 RepID=A0AB35X570_9ENTR|nr:amino acid ABC transporter permease [Kluyvera ascorbata]BBV67089.1 amino acid ABC transporter permease [Klebsiella sp. STW0522-44]HEB4873317.1 amino acid ABC transporter permease [Kluyvera ascorbata F0526]EJG2385567.1 amino acid ABC transporter permease [Kluyvera ascorbata]KFC89690.1 permease component of an ABC superfamily amino acid transporter [Kluyvera ascorbata ATCC 33433]MDT8702253.1 amino acid ABC transporter permease [Kluyvera ascorbata]
MNQWAIIWAEHDNFIAGLLATLELFITAAVCGLLIGTLLCYFTEYQKRVLNNVIVGFVNLMRAIPFLILAYLLYYGLPELGISLDAWTAGLVALIIYHGAYFFEILRSQRRVFSNGYIEAAVVQGFSRYTIFRRIVLPNIFSSALPLLGNQLIICLKDTAFLSIITVQEITAAANSVQATYFIPFNAFIVAIALYWAISIVLELLVKRLSVYSAKRGMSHV